MERRRTGTGDTDFLERAFLRLILHFTWWTNRHDPAGNDLFSGGFLGLDNIGVFDRNVDLPEGVSLSQADATAWMGLFCAVMIVIAVELAQTRPVYQDMAIRFIHHFMLIVDAINNFGGTGLWDEETGFFCDQLLGPDGEVIPLKIQSVVGLVPLFAVAAIRNDRRAVLAEMERHIQAGLAARPNMRRYVGDSPAKDGPYAGAPFVALVPKERMLRILQRVLDESQFLSPYGVRSVSRLHKDQPFVLDYAGHHLEISYVPGEGNSGAFGGNSNWRGPVWFPINMLLVFALQRFGEVYGDTLAVECPTGSGHWLTLDAVAVEISRRLMQLFLPDGDGRRPCHGEESRYASDPAWRDLLLFHEYFHGETGRGVGASHQCGWTAMAATCAALLHPG